MADSVLSRTDARGVATVTLNRPAVNNAYNGEMIAALSDAMARLAADPAVRAIVLRGAGRHFQAGADLAFLQDAAAMPESENFEISRLTVATPRASVRLRTESAMLGPLFGIHSASETSRPPVSTADSDVSTTANRGPGAVSASRRRGTSDSERAWRVGKP